MFVAGEQHFAQILLGSDYPWLDFPDLLVCCVTDVLLNFVFYFFTLIPELDYPLSPVFKPVLAHLLFPKHVCVYSLTHLTFVFFSLLPLLCVITDNLCLGDSKREYFVPKLPIYLAKPALSKALSTALADPADIPWLVSFLQLRYGASFPRREIIF